MYIYMREMLLIHFSVLNYIRHRSIICVQTASHQSIGNK